MRGAGGSKRGAVLLNHMTTPSCLIRSAVHQQGQSATTLVAPQLGSCASSGRLWRLRAARHSQKEAGPLGTQPLPRVLELAAPKVADFHCLWPSRREDMAFKIAFLPGSPNAFVCTYQVR